MFNLVAYVDDSATIVVRPLDGSQGVSNSFYTSADINGNDAPVNYNISEFVDTTASQVNVALPYKEILYKYEGTGTFFAKQHNQLFGTNWGSLGYIGGTESDGSGGVNYNASTEVYNLTVPFEHMKYERIIDSNKTGTSPYSSTITDLYPVPYVTDIMWGYSADGDFESKTDVTPNTGNYSPVLTKPLVFKRLKLIKDTF